MLAAALGFSLRLTLHLCAHCSALEEQIAEKNARKVCGRALSSACMVWFLFCMYMQARERQDSERWDRQKDSEAAQYDYFAKGSAGGGGTPLRTPDGRPQTNLRYAHTNCACNLSRYFCAVDAVVFPQGHQPRQQRGLRPLSRLLVWHA